MLNCTNLYFLRFTSYSMNKLVILIINNKTVKLKQYLTVLYRVHILFINIHIPNEMISKMVVFKCIELFSDIVFCLNIYFILPPVSSSVATEQIFLFLYSILLHCSFLLIYWNEIVNITSTYIHFFFKSHIMKYLIFLILNVFF